MEIVKETFGKAECFRATPSTKSHALCLFANNAALFSSDSMQISQSHLNAKTAAMDGFYLHIRSRAKIYFFVWSARGPNLLRLNTKIDMCGCYFYFSLNALYQEKLIAFVFLEF